MSGIDLDLFDDVTVPAPLSMRLLYRSPFIADVSVIIVGPPGSVELQIRPAMLATLGGGMSLQYHSRQATPTAENPMPGCEILGGAPCYPDGTTLGPHGRFERWFRARDGQAIVDELVDCHQNNQWTLDEQEPAVAPVLDTQPGAAAQLPTLEVPPWA